MNKRKPNKGHEMKEVCPECDGEGEVEHQCTYFQTIAVNAKINTSSNQRGIKYEICPKCESIFKIRYQWNRGTGTDDVVIRPGEEKRGVSFPKQEAQDYREQWRNDRGSKGVIGKLSSAINGTKEKIKQIFQ